MRTTIREGNKTEKRCLPNLRGPKTGLRGVAAPCCRRVAVDVGELSSSSSRTRGMGEGLVVGRKLNRFLIKRQLRRVRDQEKMEEEKPVRILVEGKRYRFHQDRMAIRDARY